MRMLFGVSLISMSLGHNLPRITHIYICMHEMQKINTFVPLFRFMYAESRQSSHVEDYDWRVS